jgi:hypothetical protein
MSKDVGDDGKRKGHLTLVKDTDRGPQIRYSQEIADRICGMIAQAISLKAICEMEGMPHIITVVRWRADHPDFASAYAQAREDSADAFADEIMAIADDRSEDWKLDTESGIYKPDYDVINRAKLRVDARKWIAAKLKPASYGERVEATLKGQIDHRHAHVNIDASHLSAEQREVLRSALLPALARPSGDDPDGQDEG